MREWMSHVDTRTRLFVCFSTDSFLRYVFEPQAHD